MCDRAFKAGDAFYFIRLRGVMGYPTSDSCVGGGLSSGFRA